MPSPGLGACGGERAARSSGATRWCAAAGGDLRARSESPAERASRQEEFDRLGRAIDRLPGDLRAAVLLRHRHGLAFEEIGRRLGRTSEAARQLWWRAVERLRDQLGRAA